jgi:hypothetical protein
LGFGKIISHGIGFQLNLSFDTGSQSSQPFGDGFDNLLVNFVDGQVALDYHHPFWLALSDLPELLPDAAIKCLLLLLKAAFIRPALLGHALIAPPRAGERDL